MKISSLKIKKMMQMLARNHIDPMTGEINCTGLAEEACYMLNAYDGDDIPEIFFDLAVNFSNNKM